MSEQNINLLLNLLTIAVLAFSQVRAKQGTRLAKRVADEVTTGLRQANTGLRRANESLDSVNGGTRGDRADQANRAGRPDESLRDIVIAILEEQERIKGKPKSASVPNPPTLADALDRLERIEKRVEINGA